MRLKGKRVLITGGGVRLGRVMALAITKEGGDIFLHYNRSRVSAEEVRAEIQKMGQEVHLLQTDLADPARTTQLISEAQAVAPIFAIVNSASLFAPLEFSATTLPDWEDHLRVNLTAPFLLSQAFASTLGAGEQGRIINILDWRALRPGKDHFPYTISKAALAALTQSLAVALAPSITVNGLAFGAILPPSDGGATENILENVPAGRWANMDEVAKSLIFLLTGPSYITGEIIHLDGGRHLV
jgi:NAD(P)-dependent dehydrogenase (short-subunit alcohol dehydrogenase family)